MTTGSYDLRSSGSNGSLQQQQIQTSLLSLPIQTTPSLSSRKPAQMFKEKDILFHWICKFTPRNKIGMLLLSLVFAVVFAWVLDIGKVEVTGETIIPKIDVQSRPVSEEKDNMNGTSTPKIKEIEEVQI